MRLLLLRPLDSCVHEQPKEEGRRRANTPSCANGAQLRASNAPPRDARSNVQRSGNDAIRDGPSNRFLSFSARKNATTPSSGRPGAGATAHGGSPHGPYDDAAAAATRHGAPNSADSAAAGHPCARGRCGHVRASASPAIYARYDDAGSTSPASARSDRAYGRDGHAPASAVPASGIYDDAGEPRPVRRASFRGLCAGAGAEPPRRAAAGSLERERAVWRAASQAIIRGSHSGSA